MGRCFKFYKKYLGPFKADFVVKLWANGIDFRLRVWQVLLRVRLVSRDALWICRRARQDARNGVRRLTFGRFCAKFVTSFL